MVARWHRGIEVSICDVENMCMAMFNSSNFKSSENGGKVCGGGTGVIGNGGVRLGAAISYEVSF